MGSTRLCQTFDSLDLIGARITEINVTSPTCVREIDDQCGTDIATDFIKAVEARRQSI